MQSVVSRVLGNFRRASKNTSFSNLYIFVRRMSDVSSYSYETLAVTNPVEHVFHVELNRPDRLNAMNRKFWMEVPQCFQQISEDKNCRVVVISGAGKMFTAGLDFSDAGDLMQTLSSDELDVARKAAYLNTHVASYQKTFTSIEKCPKPVVAAVHNGCIGGGVDLITACDIRYCTYDAYFQVKEVDLGLAADVGTLQRLPKVIGNNSLVRELVYTARKMSSSEAKEEGLVSKVFPDKIHLVEAACAVAKIIATKSPVAIQGSKVNLNYSRDHTVDEGLHFQACWNMSMLQSEDLVKSATALMTKAEEPPPFSNL